MKDELRRFRDHRDEYIQSWKEDEDKIRAAAIDTDDATACNIRRRSCADVAKARPQFDPDDDDVRYPDAWLFQHPLSLAKRFSSASNWSVYIFPVPVALKRFSTYRGIYRGQRDII